jgi:acetate kinase
MGIQRFGFHGISYQYCAQRAKEMLQEETENMVICHLGAGASLCAVKRGKSIDTTMGLTPLEGLMMDTRSGTIDPGIILYLLQKKGKTSEQLSSELYTQSGLLGISGVGSDMREVLKQAEQGHTRAQLAIDMYTHQLNKMLGSMVASLGGLDTLVFTGGIGENNGILREKIARSFQFLGLRLAPSLQKYPQDTLISTKDSKVNALLIHTQEAFEIGRQCWNLMHHKR